MENIYLNRRFRMLGFGMCICFFLIALSCLTVQENADNDSKAILGVSIFTAKDLAYGSHAEQKLDVYLPQGKEGPHPVFFQVHGGGWHWGDKSEYEYSIEDYRAQGFAVININYRLGNMNYTIDEKLDDIHSAMSFVYDHQEEWNLSDDLTITGGSAGGHMVLQYGFTLGLDKVDRIISYSGPTDLSNPFYSKDDGLYGSISALFKGKNPSQEQLRNASPLYSIPENPGPAVMLVHGNADQIVDINDSLELHKALTEAGWDSTIIEIPNVGHDFEGTDWGWVYTIFGPWMDRQMNR